MWRTVKQPNFRWLTVFSRFDGPSDVIFSETTGPYINAWFFPESLFPWCDKRPSCPLIFTNLKVYIRSKPFSQTLFAKTISRLINFRTPLGSISFEGPRGQTLYENFKTQKCATLLKPYWTSALSISEHLQVYILWRRLPRAFVFLKTIDVGQLHISIYFSFPRKPTRKRDCLENITPESQNFRKLRSREFLERLLTIMFVSFHKNNVVIFVWNLTFAKKRVKRHFLKLYCTLFTEPPVGRK